jgi:hypothetical protein
MNITCKGGILFRQAIPAYDRASITVLSLTCEHCGAPLEVPEKARFVTCTYCSARLEVLHSGNAVYTHVLEALQQRTEQIAEDVRTLKLQSRLDQLDREWMLEREKYGTRGEDGRINTPKKTNGAGLAVAIAFGIVWTVTAAAMSPFMALFGLAWIAFAVHAAVNGSKKADDFERKQRLYEYQRQEILGELRQREAGTAEP